MAIIQPNGADRRIWSFVLIWLGQLVSMLGSGLTNFTLGVWVYQRTGSATQFTLIAVMASLPAVLILPIAGALTDRFDRRRVMIISNCGAGFTKLVIVVLLFSGRLELWQVYLAVVAVSTFSISLDLVYTTTTTLLVPKEHFGRASGMTHGAQATAQIISPLLAGILIAVVHIEGVLLIDLATYLFAISTLLIVRLPKMPASTADKTEKGTMLGEARYGWTFIRARNGLLALLIYFAAVNFAVGISQVLFTPMILSISSPKMLGIVLSIAGAGFLCGSIVMSLWGGPKHRVLGIFSYGSLFGLSTVLVGIAPSITPIALASFAMFFMIPIINGCSQAIWQSKTPVGVQGRVFAVRRMIGLLGTPVAYLVAGPLADRLFEPLLSVNGPLAGSVGQIIGYGPGRGIGLIFIIMGILTILAQVGGYLYPRLREVETELPDAIALEAVSQS